MDHANLEDISIKQDAKSIENSMASPYEIAVDYQDVFKTMELFETRQALVSWVRERALSVGIVVVVLRSEIGNEQRRARLWLACERSGHYRDRKRKLVNGIDKNKEEGGRGKEETKKESKKASNERRTGTKKCDCPFLLKGTQFIETGQWSLKVICGSHNHPTAMYLEGHSYAGRLTPAEEKLVADLSMTNSRPKDILFTLQKRFSENKSTIKTIYNIRQKHRHVEHAGRSQMQYLLGKLQENKFFYHTRQCEQTNTVKDMFFAHPISVQLLRSFPHVVLMDCTYKTNRYKLPLLEIVGVTSTGMTFSVACAYLMCEKEDNYIWACTILKGLMDQYTLPSVFVTDRELALMNAIMRTFPRSRHLLCRWHINKNIMAHCKKMFRTKEQWDSFFHSWNLLVFANTEHRFNELVRRFEEDFTDHSDAVKYALDNWITLYKERFVSCWTNNVMHFDNTTTSRAEGQHSKLKRQLGSSTGNFETCWSQIYTLLETSHNAVKSSFEKSINVVQHRYKSPIFKLLRGVVSITALDKILEEMTGVEEFGIDPLLCGCVLRKKCGLPCAHEIAEHVRVNMPIPIERVDKFWRKLDMEPVAGVTISVGDDIGSRWTETIGEINHFFSHANESEKLLMLKRLREIANPTTTTLIEPEIQTRPRGRPKTAKVKHSKSTKRDPSAFEYVQSIEDSCSPMEDVIVFSGPSSTQPVFSTTRRKKQTVVRQATNLSGSTPLLKYIESIPALFRNYVSTTTDVVGDGHCGFRAIAALMGFGEESWARVRADLLHELRQDPELYAKIFLEHGRVQKIDAKLDYFNDYGAPRKYWLGLPEMGHLIATVYNVALVTLSALINQTFLPLKTAAPPDPKLICIALVNKAQNHFIQVSLTPGHPIPPILAIWHDHRSDCAAGWETIFSQQLILHNSLVVPRKKVGHIHVI